MVANKTNDYDEEKEWNPGFLNCFYSIVRLKSRQDLSAVPGYCDVYHSQNHRLASEQLILDFEYFVCRFPWRGQATFRRVMSRAVIEENGSRKDLGKSLSHPTKVRLVKTSQKLLLKILK